MKTTAAFIVALMVSSGALAAQNPSNSGVINRDTNSSNQQGADVVQADEVDQQTRQIMVSYDPADLDDNTGMDSYEVITWTDRRGVRHYTDDKKKAPSYSKTRNIYSLPPATKIDDPQAPDSYELVVEKEELDD